MNRFSFRTTLILAFFQILCSIAFAQGESKTSDSKKEETPNPVVHLEAVSAVSFSTILKALSAQTHLAFVAEGVPLKAQTSEESVQVLCAADEPLRAKMSKVGNAFDYDVEYKPGVCLMRKRYSNPDDLPTVTYEECVYFAKEAERATRSYQKPLEDRGLLDPILRFLKASTPEQVRQFKDQGLPVAQMNEAQRTLLLRFIYEAGMRVYPFEALPNALQDIRRRNAMFAYENISDIFNYVKAELPVLGFRTSTTTVNVYGFLPVSQMELIDTWHTPFASVCRSTASGLSTDPSAWTRQDSADFDERLKISGANTVGEAVESISRLNPNATYRTDAGVDRKRVTIIGTDRGNAPSVMRAILDLYELTIVYDPDKTMRVAFKPMIQVRVTADLATALPGSYPDSLVRYYRNAEHQQLKAVLKEQPFFNDHFPEVAATMANERADAVARKPLCKRLRMLVEPRLDKVTHRLLLTDMEARAVAEVRDLLGMMHMIGVYQTVQFATQYAKWEPIAHFDNVVFKGTYDAKPDGSVLASYTINVRQPNNTLLNYSRSSYSVPSLADREAGAELLRQSGAVSPQ